MTDKHITDQAYDIIDSSLTGPEAFAAGPLFNTPHQLQFKAIKEYEENRYEANKSFRDEYLTPASTKHIVDDNTQRAVEELRHRPRNRPRQPTKILHRANENTIDDIALSIDYHRGRKKRGIPETTGKTLNLTTMATGIATTGAFAYDAAAGLAFGVLSVLEAASMSYRNATTAKTYREKNKALTYTEDGSVDTFRDDLLNPKTKAALSKHRLKDMYDDYTTPINQPLQTSQRSV
jgi:hypothetical protein